MAQGGSSVREGQSYTLYIPRMKLRCISRDDSTFYAMDMLYIREDQHQLCRYMDTTSKVCSTASLSLKIDIGNREHDSVLDLTLKRKRTATGKASRKQKNYACAPFPGLHQKYKDMEEKHVDLTPLGSIQGTQRRRY